MAGVNVFDTRSANRDVGDGPSNGLKKLTFAELAGMLHGLLFAYEKVFINLYGDDARELYPYLIDELSHILRTGDDPIIDESKSLEENIERIILFISNEEYLKDVKFKKEGDGRYVFSIGSCSFARSGVHDILKIKDGTCPFALIIASCLTYLTPNGYVRVTKNEFDNEGSKSYLESITVKGKAGKVSKGGNDALQEPFTRMDGDLYDASDLKVPLDELDIRILRELRRDGRQANVDLSRALETSESTVRRRINSLQERGIIRGFTALLHYLPGENYLRAFIGLKVSPKFMERISDKLCRINETCSVYKALGRHNLICEAIFSDRAKFQEFIDDLQYTEGVMELDYSITSSARKPCPWHGF